MLKKGHLLTATILSGFIGAYASSSFAQLPGQETTVADPGRIGEQFEQGNFLPQSQPDVQVRELQLENAPAGAENIRFTLAEIQLEGVSAYTAGQLRTVYSNQLGQTISLADLYTIANDMAMKYRNDGYSLARVIVPPQTIEGGVARLQVVEGYIDQIIIQAGDEEENALRLIREYASQMASGGALNIKELERALLLINDLPGVDARTVLSPSSTQPGAADVLLIVNRDPFDALLAADNFGSRFLGPVQVTAAGSLNSFFGRNETLSAQVVVAPDSGYELGFISVGYDQPIFDNGTVFNSEISYTKTKPGFTLEEFDVVGTSRLYSVGLTQPFIRSRSTNLSGRITFDWRDVKSENNLLATTKDRLRMLRMGARADFLDTLVGIGINTVDIELSKGLDILGATEEGDNNITRTDANPEAFKVRAELQRLQRITNNLNLLAYAEGQWASEALLSSEEFGVGGASLGRAYDPSEVIGDDGIAGKLELQLNQPYEIQHVENYQLYAFYDIGRVWNKDATTNAQKRDSIASAGFGVRSEFGGQTNAGFGVAFPLTREVQTQNDDGARVYMNVSKQF